MSGKLGEKAGAGCLVLFGVPFLLGGLFAGWEAIQEFQGGGGDNEQLIFLTIFALVFCGAGIGVMLLGVLGSRVQGRTERAKQLHPGEPWMWNQDWAQGQIKCSNKGTAIFAWVFALFWNLVSAPVLFLVPEEIFEKGNQAAWLAYLFPLVGIGLLYWAVRATIRWRKFGRSTFVMSAVPGVIGGRVAGAIHTSLTSAPPKGVKLTLSSVHVRKSRDSDSSDTRNVLWQEDAEIPAHSLLTSPDGMMIPVSFRIPHDCQPTDSSDSYHKCEWKLEARAEVTGVDYDSHFEVPVFVTAQSGSEDDRESTYPTFRSDRSAAFDPAEATIPMRPSAGGGIEFYARPARNLGAAIGLTVFFLIWTGAIWLMLWFEAPLFFPVIFGLFDLLFFIAVLDHWFGTHRVVVENGEIRITGKILGIGSTKRVAYDAVKHVAVGVGMQQRESITQAGRAWYDVSVHPKVGRKKTALSAIRNKREAEWIAEQIKQRIGLRDGR